MPILIVDDEADMRDMLFALLSAQNFAVETAASGLEALERIEAKVFDAVILDYRMDDLNGLDVARRMRNDGSACPILLYSAYLSADLRSAAAELDVVPVGKTDIAHLLEALRRVPRNGTQG